MRDIHTNVKSETGEWGHMFILYMFDLMQYVQLEFTGRLRNS